jgi:hypothetical protein
VKRRDGYAATIHLVRYFSKEIFASNLRRFLSISREQGCYLTGRG